MSLIDPMYSSGEFFQGSPGELDAEYKISQVESLLKSNQWRFPEKIAKIADVGCGSGRVTRLLNHSFHKLGYTNFLVDGFDVHPSMPDGDAYTRFVQGDFCAYPDMDYDFSFLFDVIEHVPDPISFMRQVALRSDWMVLHIPLDDALLIGMRNLYRSNLAVPGHLIILNIASSLSLLACAGLRVVDYAYSPVFTAPSGLETALQKITNPIRHIFYRINPYLTQRLLGGVSLTVLAKTPRSL